MYLFEKGIWETATACPARRAEEDEALRAAARKGNKIPLAPIASGENVSWGSEQRVDCIPSSGHNVYLVTREYIDVRAGWLEEKRGLVTFLFLGFGVGVMGQLYYGTALAVGDFFFALREVPGRVDVETLISVPLMVAIVLAATYGIYKYCWSIIRLELFTQRHIIVRFNRITRQVHINRPKYAGGIVTLPWDATLADIDPDRPDTAEIGGQLILAWPMEFNGAGYDEMTFVGEPMDGNRQVVALWEYIRRFMEEGPDAVPAPRRLRPLFPWPWESVRSTLNFMAPLWRRQARAYALVVGLLLSPLMLLHAACHWISLLLCWPARWPKEIREAGCLVSRIKCNTG